MKINVFNDIKGLKRDENKLGTLGALVSQATRLEEEIAEAELALKSLKERHRELTDRELPQVMAELQLTEFASQDRKVKIADVVQGSLPKDPAKRNIAVEYMREHGGEEILRATINIEFPKGDLEGAETLARRIRKATNQEVVVDLTAHHSSYSAWARELMRNGEKLPVDDLGIFTARRAEIKAIKKRR